jgi:putative ABC transport system substrate-binding protein
MSDFNGMIKMVRYLHPGIKRIGTVFAPAEINSVSYKDRLAAAAKKQGILLIATPANSSTEVLDAANSLVSQRIEAICQISDNLTGSCSSAILKVAHESKVPYYGFVTSQIKQGAIAVSARDYFQAGYEAGQMGIEVLAGKNPASIPYSNVKKTDYLINPEIAKLFNIPISDHLFKMFPQLKLSTP